MVRRPSLSWPRLALLPLMFTVPLPLAWAQAPAGRPPVVPRPAPGPGPSGDFKREEARRHFEQGVALYEEGNYQGALAEFQAAYDAAPAATIRYNIGLTYKALFRYTDAIETLQSYLGDAAKEGKVTPERRTQVQQLIEEMKSLLAPVTFLLAPPGAKLVIDGRPTTPAAGGVVQLAAGSHVAEASADGYEPQRHQFTVAAGIPLTQELKLAAIVRTGTVRVSSSEPNTHLSIDGKDRGFAPLQIELPAGGHQLAARADGFETYRSELTLAPGQERSVEIELRRPPPPERPAYKRWWFWTGLGTAVAGGTVAAFMLRPGTRPPLESSFATFDVSR